MGGMFDSDSHYVLCCNYLKFLNSHLGWKMIDFGRFFKRWKSLDFVHLATFFFICGPKMCKHANFELVVEWRYQCACSARVLIRVDFWFWNSQSRSFADVSRAAPWNVICEVQKCDSWKCLISAVWWCSVNSDKHHMSYRFGAFQNTARFYVDINEKTSHNR